MEVGRRGEERRGGKKGKTECRKGEVGSTGDIKQQPRRSGETETEQKKRGHEPRDDGEQTNKKKKKKKETRKRPAVRSIHPRVRSGDAKYDEKPALYIVLSYRQARNGGSALLHGARLAVWRPFSSPLASLRTGEFIGFCAGMRSPGDRNRGAGPCPRHRKPPAQP